MLEPQTPLLASVLHPLAQGGSLAYSVHPHVCPEVHHEGYHVCGEVVELRGERRDETRPMGQGVALPAASVMMKFSTSVRGRRLSTSTSSPSRPGAGRRGRNAARATRAQFFMVLARVGRVGAKMAFEAETSN